MAVPARAELRIGVTPGSLADTVLVAAQEAKATGLAVRVVEFSTWTTPNVALDAGDIDLNVFQHRSFMENAEKQKGYRFDIVGLGILQNIGLFSIRHKSADQIPAGGKVAIANDPVNQGRGLLAEPGLGGRYAVLTGDAVSIADELQSWVEDGEVDGFNLSRIVVPERFSDVIDLVIPELQDRGLYKTAYAPGSLRRKLFGAGDRLPDRHAAHAFRHPIPA